MVLDKEIIFKALSRLGELAEESGMELHICIYGGSAMILAYDSRMVSKDVDVIIHPAEEGLMFARRVGEEMGLHSEWMNNHVKAYISATKDHEGRRPLDLPFETRGIKLEIPTAGYLLAMKARACREPVPGHMVDAGDLKFLIKKMEIKSLEQIEQQMDRYFPEDPLRPEARIMIERIIDEVNGECEKEKNHQTRYPG